MGGVKWLFKGRAPTWLPGSLYAGAQLWVFVSARSRGPGQGQDGWAARYQPAEAGFCRDELSLGPSRLPVELNGGWEWRPE
jgi:hypothetical protein